VGQEIRVWKNGEEGSPIFDQKLKPKTMTIEQSFHAPEPTETKHWLRRLNATGTCDGSVTVFATLYSFGPKSEESKMKRAFNGASTEFNGPVHPNKNTPVKLDAPGPLKCTTDGIPALDYLLSTGMTASGQVAMWTVQYEPSS